MTEIPNANKYAAFADVSIEAINKRFDDKLIGQMLPLIGVQYQRRFWEPIKNYMLKVVGNNNARPAVLDVYFQCPYADFTDEVRKKIKSMQDAATDAAIADALQVDTAVSPVQGDNVVPITQAADAKKRGGKKARKAARAAAQAVEAGDTHKTA